MYGKVKHETFVPSYHLVLLTSLVIFACTVLRKKNKNAIVYTIRAFDSWDKKRIYGNNYHDF